MTNRPITEAMIETGLLEANEIALFQRWGQGPEQTITVTHDGTWLTREKIVERLLEALESRDQVQLRDTDLDILQQYLSTRESGRLVLPKTTAGKTNTVAVEYSVTQLGEFVLPWTFDDHIFDVLTDQETYLRPAKATGRAKTYFSSARELFFGGRKAFVVCTPIVENK